MRVRDLRVLEDVQVNPLTRRTTTGRQSVVGIALAQCVTCSLFSSRREHGMRVRDLRVLEDVQVNPLTRRTTTGRQSVAGIALAQCVTCSLFSSRRKHGMRVRDLRVLEDVQVNPLTQRTTTARQSVAGVSLGQYVTCFSVFFQARARDARKRSTRTGGCAGLPLNPKKNYWHAICSWRLSCTVCDFFFFFFLQARAWDACT